VLALVLAACGDAASNAMLAGPKLIAVTIQELGFQPSEIAVKVGQAVKIVLSNKWLKLGELARWTSHQRRPERTRSFATLPDRKNRGGCPPSGLRRRASHDTEFRGLASDVNE